MHRPSARFTHTFVVPAALLARSACPVPEVGTRFRNIFDRALRISKRHGIPDVRPPPTEEVRTTLGLTQEEIDFVQECKAHGKISDVLTALLDLEGKSHA